MERRIIVIIAILLVVGGTFLLLHGKETPTPPTPTPPPPSSVPIIAGNPYEECSCYEGTLGIAVHDNQCSSGFKCSHSGKCLPLHPTSVPSARCSPPNPPDPSPSNHNVGPCPPGFVKLPEWKSCVKAYFPPAVPGCPDDYIFNGKNCQPVCNGDDDDVNCVPKICRDRNKAECSGNNNCYWCSGKCQSTPCTSSIIHGQPYKECGCLKGQYGVAVKSKA